MHVTARHVVVGMNSSIKLLMFFQFSPFLISFLFLILYLFYFILFYFYLSIYLATHFKTLSVWFSPDFPKDTKMNMFNHLRRKNFLTTLSTYAVIATLDWRRFSMTLTL